MKKLISLLLTTLLVAMALCTAYAADPVVATFVDTTGGKVQGYRFDGVDNFFAIQYATAERFQDPVAYSWDNVRICNVMGEVAPQNTIATASRDLFNSFGYNLLQTQSEQYCLQLNVWTPEASTSDARPVVVWLHGGGYSTGSSTQFNFYLGETLAKEQDVVFVSVNHRLNSLGYLDVSAYGGEEYAYSGNAGMQDIVLALQWVQDNIASFGGDASNVTIVGQSGGGGKVTTLMSMPTAQGLFHKAVAISGGSVQLTRDTEAAQADAAKVVEVLGMTDATNEEIMACLTSLSYDELYAACATAGISYGPVLDGDLIPTGNYEMSKDIPFLATNVLGEFSTNYAEVVPFSFTEENYYARQINDMTEEQTLAAYVAKYGEEYGPQIMAAFQEAYPSHKAAEGLYLNNRYGAGMSAIPLVDAMVSYGGTAYNSMEAYSYAMYGTIVAIHTASSIPFWFGNVDDIPEFVAGDEDNARKVNDAMSGALGAFARTGNPSTDALAWDAYTTENGECMVFDSESTMKNHHDKALFELINAAGAGSAAH